MPELSIIISTYNWPEALKLCLLSIKEQTVLPIEVIIADDGSEEATKIAIAGISKSFPVPLIHVWQEDLGFRKTIILNKAVKIASAPYILQIDGDVILEKHFVKDHMSLAEPNVFVRGSRAHITRNRLPEIFKTSALHYSFMSKGIINRFNAVRLPLLAFLFEKKSNNPSSVRGSNLAFWKSDFILVNGYNNDLSGWGHEDEELAVRFTHNNILKKTIKLKAVQFHLSHTQLSLKDEPKHTAELALAIQLKYKVCKNGYEQS